MFNAGISTTHSLLFFYPSVSFCSFTVPYMHSRNMFLYYLFFSTALGFLPVPQQHPGVVFCLCLLHFFTGESFLWARCIVWNGLDLKCVVHKSFKAWSCWYHWFPQKGETAQRLWGSEWDIGKGVFVVTEASQHTCSSVQESMTAKDNPKNMLSQLSAGIQCLSFNLYSIVN